MASFAGLVNQAANGLGGLLGKQSELARQRLTHDDKYYREFVAFFELVQPRRPSYLFPLVAGISQYQLAEPFACDVVPTDYAGLGVHRSGIVQRRLQISGHTGFAPRQLPVGVVPPSATSLPKNYASRNLPAKVLAPLSGQRIFQYLQESLFRAYSDLCRDPATAAGTKMLFHDPREDAHWQVEPQSFTLQRNQSSNFTYPFIIDLIIVGPAAPTSLPLAQTDAGVLDRFNDAVASVSDALANLSGAIDDLGRVQASFRVMGQKVAAIVDRGANVVQAASAFVAGTERLINVPLATVYALFNLCTEVCGLFGNLVDTGTAVADWPTSVVARFRGMQNACDALIGQVRVFTPPLQERLDTLGQPVAPNRAANVTTATTFEGINQAGTANLPGMAAAQAQSLASVTDRPGYQSVRMVFVRQGDTLQTLAGRELGSTALWRDLATLNDMKAPYAQAGDLQAASPAQADGQTGVLTYGRSILVPSTDPPPEDTGNPVVFGVPPERPQEEQALGRGLAVERLPSTGGDPLYDLAMGMTDGMPDFATRQGVGNLAQVVELAVVQARGSSPLYPDVGLEGLVGTGIPEVDESLRDYRIAQALAQDPRIEAVVALQVDANTQPDALLVSAECQVKGLSATASVSFAV